MSAIIHVTIIINSREFVFAVDLAADAHPAVELGKQIISQSQVGKTQSFMLTGRNAGYEQSDRE